MNQLLETILEQDKAEADFDSLFRPLSDEEIDKRANAQVKKRLEEGQCTQNPDGSWSCERDVDLEGF
ncbi:MAG: hypothetical protein ACTSVF_03355, partial [Candidatus Asgardarchaeia archaeon]